MKTQFDDHVVGASAPHIVDTPTQSFESSPTDSRAQRDTTSGSNLREPKRRTGGSRAQERQHGGTTRRKLCGHVDRPNLLLPAAAAAPPPQVANSSVHPPDLDAMNVVWQPVARHVRTEVGFKGHVVALHVIATTLQSSGSSPTGAYARRDDLL